MKTPIQAIESVLDKRSQRGASDKSLINYLEHLKTVWKSTYMQNVLNSFIDLSTEIWFPIITTKQKIIIQENEYATGQYNKR